MLMNLSKDQASLRIDRRSGKHLVYDVTVKCTNANTRDEKWSAATRRARRATQRGCCGAETHGNRPPLVC